MANITKQNYNRLFLFIFLLISIFLFSSCTKQKNNSNILLMPNLPYPIAREPVLITSAGQGPEGLIVAKMCDKLKLNNAYSYKAEVSDLKDKGCLVIACGISGDGLKSAFTSLEEDKARIITILDEADKLAIPIIAVFPAGKLRRTPKDDEVTKIVVQHAQYVIAIQNANYDNNFTNLAQKNKFRLTLVERMQDVPVPLNSVFR